jgi:hypothetical protein
MDNGCNVPRWACDMQLSGHVFTTFIINHN